MKNNYHVEPRSGWFNGAYDHVVKIRDKGDAILCAAPKHCCDVVAHALNMLNNLKSKI